MNHKLKFSFGLAACLSLAVPSSMLAGGSADISSYESFGALPDSILTTQSFSDIETWDAQTPQGARWP